MQNRHTLIGIRSNRNVILVLLFVFYKENCFFWSGFSTNAYVFVL